MVRTKEDIAKKIEKKYGKPIRSILSELYEEEKLNISQIARRIGMRYTTTWTLLTEFGIHIPQSMLISQKKKLSIAHKKHLTWEDMYGVERANEMKKNLSEKLSKAKRGKKRKPFSEAWRKNISKARIGKKHTEAQREKLSRAMTKCWQDPEYIQKVMRGLNAKPNKQELLLDKIIQRVCPGEFGYNGNFELGVTIGGMIPDWVNINGQKKLIELFGEPWHRDELGWKRTEFGKKAIFSQLGYGTLIIWGSELTNEDAVVEKVRNFAQNIDDDIR